MSEESKATGEEAEAVEAERQPKAPPSQKVMILFMGSNHQHALTSIQYYVPDAVHIVTSDDFRDQYVRRLNEWSKKYGFRKGTVESIPDLFERTAADSLLSCVFRIVGAEYKHSSGGITPFHWRIGITGGTMHMAAVATLAANIIDSQAFYVIKPGEGEAVMPNKQVIELPSLISLKTAMALNPVDVSFILNEGEGHLDDLGSKTEVSPWLVGRMKAVGMMDTHPKEPLWRLTTSGYEVLMMLSSGPMFDLRMEDAIAKMAPSGDGDGFESGFYA